jgi:hypothetical protein
MRSVKTPTVILALGMLLLGARLGNGVALALDPAAGPVAKVGLAAMQRRAYLPVIFRIPRPPVWRPAPGSTWLEFVNYYRALASLPPVTEDPALTYGAQQHAHYMILNNVIEPFEVSIGRQGYTPEGAAAAANSLLLGSTTSATTDEQVLAYWMQGPFHALGVLDPALRRTGFGSERNPGGAIIRTAAALDIVSGLDQSAVPPPYPVLWPDYGMTVSLRSYTQGTDSPEPLTSCPGYLSPTGLPLLIQLGDGSLPAVSVTSSNILQGTTPVEHCIFTEYTYTNPDSILQARGRAVLGARDAIVLIPRYPLVAGATYTVSVTANGLSYQWSFTAGN